MREDLWMKWVHELGPLTPEHFYWLEEVKEKFGLVHDVVCSQASCSREDGTTEVLELRYLVLRRSENTSSERVLPLRSSSPAVQEASH